MAPQTDIDLYTMGTPNGHKVSIVLEELGIKYNSHKVDITKNQQKEPWFLEINPNGRIPALVDKTSGKPKRIFEGASMMLYMCEKYDQDNKISFKYDSDEYWEMVEWMIWMQSGIGPMQGQANHFFRYAPQKIDYAINRYQTETKRLYQVLNDRLAAQQKAGQGLWIVANKYSLADICCFSWVNWAAWAGIETEPFPELVKWAKTIEARDAVERGVNVPEPFELRERMRSKEAMEAYAKKNSDWIMQGMKADGERHKI